VSASYLVHHRLLGVLLLARGPGIVRLAIDVELERVAIRHEVRFAQLGQLDLLLALGHAHCGGGCGADGQRVRPDGASSDARRDYDVDLLGSVLHVRVRDSRFPGRSEIGRHLDLDDLRNSLRRLEDGQVFGVQRLRARVNMGDLTM